VKSGRGDKNEDERKTLAGDDNFLLVGFGMDGFERDTLIFFRFCHFSVDKV
jgi:hypothetical protein